VSTPPKYRKGEELIEGALFRRIPNSHSHWKQQEQKPTKYNFTPDGADEYLSTQLAEYTTPEKIFAKYPGFGLLEIEIRILRARGLRVTYEPGDDTDHTAVWGLKGPKNAVRRELCELTTQLWEPGTSQPLARRDPSTLR
jgi:hypothetical protein